MNLNYMVSLLALFVLFLLVYLGIDVLGLQLFFGIIVPYIAVIVFFVGFLYRILYWARSPVPFQIPTTCGQQKSLPWIKPNKIDNPNGKCEVVIRMILEIFLFRSLFRNTKSKLHEKGTKISYEWEIWLWVAALAFHYTFFVVLIRHLRFFLEPVPFFITALEKLDGFFQIGLPVLLMSGLILFVAIIYLLLRRILLPKVRYISLASDYFPLFLILAIAFTGILMRYFTRVDVEAIKQLTMGLATFHPVIPEGIGSMFYIHLFFICVLVSYIPFSKLMHMGGIFMSPTRNMTTNSRAIRHVNPWDYPVKTHTYEEYEDEFREKMIEAGIPVEKE